MSKYIYKIIFMSCVLNVSSIQYADLAGRAYNQKIIAIEKMLDGLITMNIEFAQSNLKLLRDTTVSPDRVERINNAYRRFNVFMNAENHKRTVEAAANPAPVPLAPGPKQSLQPIINPVVNPAPIEPLLLPEPVTPQNPVSLLPLVPTRLVELPAPIEPLLLPEPVAPQNYVPLSPLIEGMTPEQQLETLLLYVQSLASTADVAITVNQKNNAHTILAQAASQIPLMQTILAQHPHLVQRFTARIQTISNRIAKTQEEVDLMS